MERIIFWLESKDSPYMEGLDLYESLPNHNKNLARNLRRNETALNRQKLRYELKKYIDVQPKQSTTVFKPVPAQIAPVQPSSPVIESVKKEESKTAPLFHQLPTQLRPTLLEANNLFKENCLLKAELNDLPFEAEEQALLIMRKIDQNVKANELAWSKIDYWLEHKQLPKDNTVVVAKLTMDQLINQRNLLESSISRLKKRLTANKTKIAQADIQEQNKLSIKISKQEKLLLEKEELLFQLKAEIDERK
ncbi:hypothetical protein [Myroides odoratus]|uniref:hypothetical protein n=1 Tax=Myroides odoratus TaxID=256 RepID=UPI003341A718